jgi:hypothetical protein
MQRILQCTENDMGLQPYKTFPDEVSLGVNRLKCNLKATFFFSLALFVALLKSLEGAASVSQLPIVVHRKRIANPSNHLDGLRTTCTMRCSCHLALIFGRKTFIEVHIIQWYLSKRISEWFAFGGIRLYQTCIYNTRNTGRRAFLRPFYWDLWKDIRTLREEALKVKACTHYVQKLWRGYKGKQVVDI